MPAAAILISRQNIRPCRKNSWVRAAIEAVKWISHQGYTILTSEGMQTFELLIYLSVKNRIDQTIVLSASDMHRFIGRYLWVKTQFDLHKINTVFIPLISANDKVQIQPLRDRFIAENADILFPVSIRSGGVMSKLIDDALARGKKINRRFETDYQEHHGPVKYSLQNHNLNENLKKLDIEYIVHWTRTASYCWPGERLQQYYQAISESDTYPRNAFNTLQNIVSTKCIKASSRHMPLNTSVVSFTGNSPCGFLSLMRWRSRYIEMSFEPYGIGIEKKAALRFGIRPVTYIKSNTTKSNPDQWLFQSCGKKGNWPEENEYRFAGDIDLSSFSTDQLICFCLTSDEAFLIEQNFQIRTISFL